MEVSYSKYFLYTLLTHGLLKYQYPIHITYWRIIFKNEKVSSSAVVLIKQLGGSVVSCA